MKVVISQPRYLPALNYLQRVCFADIFVVFDIVQRQARAWENRNQLLLPEPKWLTIPIESSSRALVREAKINGRDWAGRHKKQIIMHYGKAPFFDERILAHYYAPYETEVPRSSLSFSELTIAAIINLFDHLALPHNFQFASEFCGADILSAEGPDKLRLICERLNAEFYISGENGRGYGVAECFAHSKCTAVFHAYHHPEYSQMHSPKVHIPYMGFFDALFNKGEEWFRKELLAPPSLVN